jgi:large subunit ribosomal protein L20
MVRIKRGKQARKRRKLLLKEAKGFRWGRKSKFKLAKDALRHAWEYSYRDRKVNKRSQRQLWQVKINAASRMEGISYSKFIKALKDKKIEIDRKILAKLAEEKPELFKKIVEKIQQK